MLTSEERLFCILEAVGVLRKGGKNAVPVLRVLSLWYLLPRKLGRSLENTLPKSYLNEVDFKQTNKRKRFPK